MFTEIYGQAARAIEVEEMEKLEEKKKKIGEEVSEDEVESAPNMNNNNTSSPARYGWQGQLFIQGGRVL